MRKNITCKLCGRPSGNKWKERVFHRHHINPKYLGGGRTLPLCYRCHRWITKIQNILRENEEWLDHIDDQYYKKLVKEKIKFARMYLKNLNRRLDSPSGGFSD
jgi:hypothetical protein